MTLMAEGAAYQLYQGDCLEVMRGMEAGSVVTITDPPYYGREDLFSTESIPAFLDFIKNDKYISFWPATHDLPIRFESMSVWHKSIPIHPNSKIGNVSGHHFERIYSFGVGRKCEVFRFAAIIPGFEAVKDELVSVGSDGHPTQKPINLMVALINKTPKDSVVFDPFMGSGTTGVACMQLGRRFIGCEIDPNYFQIAKRRIEAASAQPLLIPPARMEQGKF